MRWVGKGALCAVPTIYPDRILMVGTLRFAHPCISAKHYTGVVP
jgi:hypothetical protein